jgi:ABC-2 type transport system permease protein
MMPVLLLSGILLPMTIGPDWLLNASDFMPFRHNVDATRSGFGDDFGGSEIFWGTGWAVLLCALAVWWGTSTFRKESA